MKRPPLPPMEEMQMPQGQFPPKAPAPKGKPVAKGKPVPPKGKAAPFKKKGK